MTTFVWMWYGKYQGSYSSLSVALWTLFKIHLSCFSTTKFLLIEVNKNYLRTAMTQENLFNLALLSVDHKWCAILVIPTQRFCWNEEVKKEVLWNKFIMIYEFSMSLSY